MLTYGKSPIFRCILSLDMICRLLQLNIWHGKQIEKIISYIKKGNFDIVCLQEVAAGYFAYRQINTYERLIHETGMTGQLVPYVSIAGEVVSYVGLATLFGKRLAMVGNHIVWMKRFEEVEKNEPLDFRRTPRCALATVVKENRKRLMVINTHLAWGPTPSDTVYKKNQAEKLYRWITKHTKDPVILAGDFNLNPHTTIVSKLSQLGVNLVTHNHITNTLNPRLHYAKNLFPSGLPVDYVIADRRLTIKKFFVEDRVDLSDHYGLVTEFSL